MMLNPARDFVKSPATEIDNDQIFGMGNFDKMSRRRVSWPPSLSLGVIRA